MNVVSIAMSEHFEGCVRYIKSNLLAIAVLFSIHLPQLGVMPGYTTVRPFMPFLVLVFISVLMLERVHGKRIVMASKELVQRWSGVFLVFLIYFMLIPFYGGDWYTGIKKLTSLVFAIFAWWVGYSQLGMTSERFRKLLLVSFIPFIAFGGMEFLSQVSFFSFLKDAINTVRDAVLTINIDRDRLHLQFSEPSFLATYLLLFLYLITQYRNMIILRIFFYCWLLLAMFLARSLTTLLVVGTTTFLIFWMENASFFRRLLIVSASFIVLFAGGHALLQRAANVISLEDLSAYVRFHNTLFTWKMGTSHFYLGAGFVDFGPWFSSYLGEIDLRGIREFLRILHGEIKPEPYGIFAQVFAYTGILGIATFSFALFRGIPFKTHFPFLTGAMLAMTTALPWTLPYLWVLLGMIARESKQFIRGQRFP